MRQVPPAFDVFATLCALDLGVSLFQLGFKSHEVMIVPDGILPSRKLRLNLKQFVINEQLFIHQLPQVFCPNPQPFHNLYRGYSQSGFCQFGSSSEERLKC